MTLCKLSLRNARRQARDYLVYFVTIVMVAALIYAFNGLVFSKEIRKLSGMLESMPLVIVLTSTAVVCIVGWLVQYTTRFMLEKRSRELGTYVLIGLESRQVARLFFLENLAVGGIALVLGILLGNLLFQALRAVTLALFHATYTFSYAFSLSTVALTLFYFMMIYLLALLKSRKRIRKMKICDLIYFDRQNEGEVIRKSRSRRRIFTASIVFGVTGIILLLLGSLALGILGACFIILFLYGFFISFSSGVPAYFDRHAGKKYRGHTLLIFRALSAKLGTMGVAMATIALLLTATLISEGTGMLFNNLFHSRIEQNTCFDLFIGSASGEKTRLDNYRSYIEANVPVREARQYQIYWGEGRQLMKQIEYNRDDWDDLSGYFNEYHYDTLMKASDYSALRAMLGYPEVPLKPGEYRIHCMTYLKKLMEGYDAPITAGGITLMPGGVSTESFTQSLWDGNGRGYIVIVPDEAAAGRPVSHTIYAAMTEEPVSKTDYEALCAMREEKESSVAYDTIFSKADIEEENVSMYAMIAFPLYYLALVLTMVAATVLSIQQLSETGRYRRQFELLNKLGMDRSEMKQTLRRQFAIYYTMPAVPPLFIGLPFILAMGNAFDPGVISGPEKLLGIVGLALAMFFGIYFVYILAAYGSMKRNVLPE